MLSSLGDKETKAPGFQRPDEASVSVERFACFPLWLRKLCGDQVLYVGFSEFFTFRIRLLGGSYKWIVFPRHSLSGLGKVSFFQVSDDTRDPGLG